MMKNVWGYSFRFGIGDAGVVGVGVMELLSEIEVGVVCRYVEVSGSLRAGFGQPSGRIRLEYVRRRGKLGVENKIGYFLENREIMSIFAASIDERSSNKGRDITDGMYGVVETHCRASQMTIR